MFNYVATVAQDVIATIGGVWPFLLASVVTAAAISVYLGTERVSKLLNRRSLVATAGAVALATLTPFCSCGTTAVLVGMLAASSPWAPIVAFMVASPLTSPSELVLSAGLFGWSFALVFFVGTIAIGSAAGALAHALDRSGWLRGQARVTASEPDDVVFSRVEVPAAFGPGAASVAELAGWRERWKVRLFIDELLSTGKKLIWFFLGFTTVGYLVIELIPTSWLTDHLGGASWTAVPLAALLGVPAYINTEASLPMIATLMEGGMGAGPAMAFLVTGAGTSIGAVTGLFVIARKRVVTLVVLLLFLGALALGWTAQIVV
ncbi:MAG: permease [Acidimicrobiia bacterium]|nr:permease [Acidimicrobiia bacterium]